MGQCEERLDDHKDKLKHHEKRLANQDAILAKTLEILESLNEKHSKHMGITRATHGFPVLAISASMGMRKWLTTLKLET